VQGRPLKDMDTAGYLFIFCRANGAGARFGGEPPRSRHLKTPTAEEHALFHRRTPAATARNIARSGIASLLAAGRLGLRYGCTVMSDGCRGSIS